MVTNTRWLLSVLLCLAIWPVQVSAQDGQWETYLEFYVNARLEEDKRSQAFFSEREKRLLDTLKTAEASRRYDPRMAETFEDLGSQYNLSGRLAESESHYKQALEIIDKELLSKVVYGFVMRRRDPGVLH